MEAEPPALPDPFAPAPMPRLAQFAHQPSAASLYRRRARILATTRRHVADHGYAGFKLRDIAAECEVSPQTIYNCFGNRRELLVQALNEHTTMVQSAALALEDGPAVFLRLADLYHQCSVATPGFLRELVLTAFASENSMSDMHGHGVREKEDVMRMLVPTNILRRGVNPNILATQITRLSMIAVYDWAQHDNANDLRDEMHQGTSLLLFGGLDGLTAQKIEMWRR